MPETNLDEAEVVEVRSESGPFGYVENPDFVPDPTHQYGTLDTSGTGGGAHQRLEEITPIFEVAKKQDLVTAARALDPDDDSVPESLVVLPQGQPMSVVDEDAVKERVRSAAQNAVANPVEVPGPTPAQRQAQETGNEGRQTAQAQQESQGASTGGDPEGTKRQGGRGADKDADKK